MWGWLFGGTLLSVYGLAAGRALRRRSLAGQGYLSPDEADAELDRLAAAHPAMCRVAQYGVSREGRALRALWLRGAGAPDGAPRLLVTAHIHAVEYIGAYVARAVARRLAEGYGREPTITGLLDTAQICVAPLLNPDGAQRVWRRGGFGGLGASRFTASGVDPNRNFPYVPLSGRAKWNSGRDRPGSAYYRGPHPLSEPECRALADLCRAERFCGAVNFHSFSCVVYLPSVADVPSERARKALEVFHGPFQSHQRHRRYPPKPERSAQISGQLDAFLLGAFGTPSVTVEVSMPGLAALRPGRLGNFFWIANPPQPERWAENDVDATVHALALLLERTGGHPCEPHQPELAAWERLPTAPAAAIKHP